MTPPKKSMSPKEPKTPDGPPSEFRVLAFFAADHAVVVDGKLFVNGGFYSRLNFPGYPTALPAMSIVMVLEVPFHAYHDDHNMVIGLVDADGHDLPLKVEGQFRVGAEADLKYGDPTVMPMAINIANLVLPRAGDYSFTLKVDGTEIARYAVRAVQIAAPMIFQAKALGEED